jgi:hypothetical protein
MYEATLEHRVRFFAELIKDSFSLCNFLGKTEREVLVAQTIHACVMNLDIRGKAFSFKAILLDGPHAENIASYQWCVNEGLFREELLSIIDPPEETAMGDDGRPIGIIPTLKLFAKLAGHFGKLPG